MDSPRLLYLSPASKTPRLHTTISASTHHYLDFTPLLSASHHYLDSSITISASTHHYYRHRVSSLLFSLLDLWIRLASCIDLRPLDFTRLPQHLYSTLYALHHYSDSSLRLFVTTTSYAYSLFLFLGRGCSALQVRHFSLTLLFFDANRPCFAGFEHRSLRLTYFGTSLSLLEHYDLFPIRYVIVLCSHVFQPLTNA